MCNMLYEGNNGFCFQKALNRQISAIVQEEKVGVKT